MQWHNNGVEDVLRGVKDLTIDLTGFWPKEEIDE